MNYNEEIICDYVVPSKTKKIWKIELELLSEFIEICSKFHLRYYVIAGTLLGAVRHNGFIPWDNDIDVAMPRPDYNKFLEIAPHEISVSHFFQTPKTENGKMFSTYVKIRDNNSTGGGYDEYLNGLNCGIFIDIFPLDEIPDNILTRKIYVKTLHLIKYMAYYCLNSYSKTGLKNKLIYFFRKLIYKFVFFSPNASELFDIYNSFAGKYWKRGNRYIADLSCGLSDNNTWELKCWDNIIKMNFEDIIVAVPKDYDIILSKTYGNYMNIPDDKSVPHDYYSFEPDVNFRDWFLQNPCFNNA